MKYIFIELKDEKHEHDLSPIKLVRRGFSERGRVRDMIFESVSSESEAKEAFLSEKEKYGQDAVFFACGDNRAVSAAAEVLAFTDIPMGIIPYGKCDLARKLYGEKADANDVCEALSLYGKPRMHTKKIDMAEANGRLFINCLSIGFDEKRAADAEKFYGTVPLSRRFSKKAAFAAALCGNKKWKAWLSFDVCPSENGEAQMDAYEHETEFSLLSVTNSGFSEGRRISDRSSLYDGILEVCLISPCNFAEYSGINEMYKRGVADISDKASFADITGGRISSADGSPLKYIADGKRYSADEINITVRRKALKVCVFPEDETEKTP